MQQLLLKLMLGVDNNEKISRELYIFEIMTSVLWTSSGKHFLGGGGGGLA
jgi:hypothetical protein